MFLFACGMCKMLLRIHVTDCDNWHLIGRIEGVKQVYKRSKYFNYPVLHKKNGTVDVKNSFSHKKAIPKLIR